MKGNEAGTTNREKGEKFQSGWFREIILIVLTAICTTLATQIFYKQNITSQIKMEVAKDLVLEQYHIYNKVKSLKEHYQIITYSVHIFSFCVRDGLRLRFRLVGSVFA